jgi:hypothetical protein
MKKVSTKLAQEQREYSKLRKTWLAEHPMCQAKGKYLLDVSTWLSVCRNCHNWIEVNPQDAKELGFSISRID